jgi:hypothetical protein
MEKTRLVESAKDAYQLSELRKKDIEKNKVAADKIKKFLSKFDIDVEIESNFYEIEDIRFFSKPIENSDAIYGYEVIASRKCPFCNDNITLRVLEVSDEETFIDISKEEFGQWLSINHCEYIFSEKKKGKLGF